MFSIFKKDITNTVPEKDSTLKEVHTYVTSDAAKTTTERLRNEANPDEIKRIKNTEFKFATFSATFFERSAKKLNQPSGFICIDIDKVDDTEVVMEKLKSLHNIKPALIFISPSGNGIKAIYRVSIKSAQYVGIAYKYIAKMIKDELGIDVDPAPKSVASACYLPWDPDAYLNEDAAVVEIPLEELSSPKQDSFTPSDDNELERVLAVVDYIEKKQINMAEVYGDWVKIGLSLANLGEAGRELFHRISKISPKYNAKECDEKFSNFLATANQDVSLGTFYSHSQNYDLPLSEILRPLNPKLNIVKAKETFWDDEEKDKQNKRKQNLLDNTDHPLVKQVFEEYGVEHGTLCDYNVGLGSFATASGQTKDALFVRYDKGCQALYYDGEEICTEDLPGSSPYDSFFGLEHTLEKDTVVIVNNALDAMYVSSIRDDIDVISILEPSNPMLSTKQREILREKSAYWKNIYIQRPAVKGSEKKNARSYCRLYADLMPVDSVVYWVNVGQDEMSLFQDNQVSEALTGNQVFPNAEAIWNSHTKNNRLWQLTAKGQPVVDEVLLEKTMLQKGFKKAYLNSGGKPTLVYDTNNILDTISTHEMADFIKDNIIGCYSRIVDQKTIDGKMINVTSRQIRTLFFNYREKVLNPKISMIFNNEKPEIMTDTSSTVYLYFTNGVLKVTEDGFEMIDYKSLPKKVWKSQVLKHHFDIKSESGKGEFERFIENIAGKDSDTIDSFKSGLGYLAHSYKNRSICPAIILVDKHSTADRAEGGTGKGLFARSLEHIRQLNSIPAKDHDPNSKFRFSAIGHGDQIAHFEDVKKQFDFESLFNIITDDMPIDGKYEKQFTIPFEESPKIIVSTNYYIKGSGNSFRRRQFILPFSDHYCGGYTPNHEFGHLLFNEWDDTQWQMYFHYMVRCIQFFLKNGLIACKLDHYRRNELIDSTSSEFVKWAETNLEADVLHSANVLFDGKNPLSKVPEAPLNSSGISFPCFLDSSNDLHESQMKTFKKWMRIYADSKNWALNEVPNNGYAKIEFTKK